MGWRLLYFREKDAASMDGNGGTENSCYPLVDPNTAAALACRISSCSSSSTLAVATDSSTSNSASPAATSPQSSPRRSFPTYWVCHKSGRIRCEDFKNNDDDVDDTDDLEEGAVGRGTKQPSSPYLPLPLQELVRVALDCDTALHGDNDNSLRASHTSSGEDTGPQTPQYAAYALVLMTDLELALCRKVMADRTLRTKDHRGDPSSESSSQPPKPPLSTAPPPPPHLAIVLERWEALERRTALERNGRDGPPLAPLLYALLLPNSLNLRNLLWHGFIGSLHRPWLSLLRIVIRQLEETDDKGAERSVVPREESAVAVDGMDEPIECFNRVDSPVAVPCPRSKPLPCPLVPWFPFAWDPVLERGRALRRGRTGNLNSEALDAMAEWLPTVQHAALFRWTVDVIQRVDTADATPPRTIGPALVVLLEAGLRREFIDCHHSCEGPGRDIASDALMARPGVRYITLDGHGQRRQHPLLLQPYHCQSNLDSSPLDERAGCEPCTSVTTLQRNRLIVALGGSRAALLTDLFLSPNGPNLRAALSHGSSWNGAHRVAKANIVAGQRLDNGTTPGSPDLECQRAWDCVDLLLGTVYWVAHRDAKLAYQPQFSFAAVTRADLQRLSAALLSLEELTTIPSCSEEPVLSSVSLRLSDSALERLKVPDSLSSRLQRLLVQLHLSDETDDAAANSSWPTDQLYREHKINQAVGPMVATRALVGDLALAVDALLQALEEAHSELSCPNLSSKSGTLARRRHKRNERVVACGALSLRLYAVATSVAVDRLERGLSPSKDGGSSKPGPCGRDKLVERTRMVVSTVSTFLTVNAERALKAIEDYSKSKLLDSLHDPDS